MTPWTIHSMEFSRPESPSPGDLPNPGIEPRSPALQADALPAEPSGKPELIDGVTKRYHMIFICKNKGIVSRIRKKTCLLYSEHLKHVFNFDIKCLISGDGLVARLCLTLVISMDCSPSFFYVHGFSQARILERVGISFSR